MCPQCGQSFTVRHSALTKIYCSADCQKLAYFGEPRPPALSTHTLGALNEIIVAKDLFLRGYEVFRPMSPGASCDLIAVNNGKVIRVEVRRAYRRPDGKICALAKAHPERYDVFAKVVGETIYYEPDIAV